MKRVSEARRKQARKAVTVPLLALCKQLIYQERTGKWVEPHELHWHHRNPALKHRKISHLTNRSPEKLADELRKCTVQHESEHRKIHSRQNELRE